MKDWSIRDRVLVAALFATVEDGIIASYLTWTAHLGPAAVLLSGIEATCLLAFPVAALAVPVGFFLSTPGARVLGRHIRVGLSGERPEHESTGVLLFVIALGASAIASWRLALRVSELQSARVATLMAIVSALSFALGGALVVVSVVRPIGSVLHRFTKAIAPHPGAGAWLPFEELTLATVGAVTLYVLLPHVYVNSPSALLVGFAVGPAIAGHLPLPRKLARLPVLALLGGALVLSTGASVVLGHLPGAVQMGALARAPYTSIVVATVRRAVDRDHDGYSPILGGGDCDDHDASRHPNAIDIPENGIDENCSGVDARRYTPTVQPPAQLAAPPMRDNVILIHLDALRPDHVGFVGYARPTTPRIDRFREGATWFKNAYTPAPSTRFALAALLTGREIERIPQQRGAENEFMLLPEAVTLAERLEPMGYDRVGYTLSYVLDHIKEVGQGFRVWETPWPNENWEEAHRDSARMTTEAALRYLATMPPGASKPYLLFLHYDCTHDPYVKHRAWDYGDRDVDRYDSALNYCDHHLGALFDALDARGDKDRTAVFVFSDHGELFGEHGFTNHGNTLYQPDIRVLLLAKVPGGSVREIDTPMLLTDIAPTVLELTGLPPDKQCQAWDLGPYLLRGEPMPPRSLFFYSDLWRNGVRFESRAVLDVGGRLKFIRDVSVGINQLYDLETDPDELSNLADDRPAVRDSFEALVEGWEAFETTTK